MASSLDKSNENAAPLEEKAVVATSLSDLPKGERRHITSELLRIHNLVNAAENDLRKMGGKDKADGLRID